MLLNGDDFLYLDWGPLDYPKSDMQNYGPVNLGGHPHPNKLVTLHQRFSEAHAFTICSYAQTIIQTDQSCAAIPENKQSVSLSPFSSDQYDCRLPLKVTDAKLKRKAEYLCKIVYRGTD